jgi:cytochrome c oxidase subunit 2
MTELHNSIFYYLIAIAIGVSWIMYSIVVNFNSTTQPLSHKYYNHGTLVELVWTVTPALILVAIAFPSFKLLYVMDKILYRPILA